MPIGTHLSVVGWGKRCQVETEEMECKGESQKGGLPSCGKAAVTPRGSALVPLLQFSQSARPHQAEAAGGARGFKLQSVSGQGLLHLRMRKLGWVGGRHNLFKVILPQIVELIPVGETLA